MKILLILTCANDMIASYHISKLTNLLPYSVKRSELPFKAAKQDKILNITKNR